MPRFFLHPLSLLAVLWSLPFLRVAASPADSGNPLPGKASPEPLILVSVKEQKLALFENGMRVAKYDISTSRYGVGDRLGSYATPVGKMEVAEKIGAGRPMGAVFKNRHPTGEILSPNARGRDPIVSRILHLRGLEASTRNAYQRGIYIHGTPVERQIGRPVSYGCIRMRSRDVADLFQKVGIGTPVRVLAGRLP